MRFLRLLIGFLPLTAAFPLPPFKSLARTGRTKPRVPVIDLSRWQSLLPDSTPLSRLSIPGTHDTMSYPKPPRRSLPLLTQTQVLPLASQLSSGVRYLDLRLQHHEDRFVLHHGSVYLHFDLPSVLRIVEAFFAGGSGGGARETLVVRASCNNCHVRGQKKFGNTRSFLATAEWYFHDDPATRDWFARRAFVSAGWHVPTLGETRGKVVFVQDFPEGEPWGKILWRDQLQVLIQDQWDLKLGKDLKRKVNAVKEFFLETVWPLHDPPPEGAAAAAPKPGPPLPPPYPPPLTINHLSGSGLLCCSPADTSRYVYKSLYGWLRHGWDNGGGRPMGIVAGDYVTTNVARVIVEKNFLKGGAGEAVKVDFDWKNWGKGWRQMVKGRLC